MEDERTEYDKMRRSQLEKIAREKGISTNYLMTKHDLMLALKVPTSVEAIGAVMAGPTEQELKEFEKAQKKKQEEDEKKARGEEIETPQKRKIEDLKRQELIAACKVNDVAWGMKDKNTDLIRKLKEKLNGDYLP